MGRNVDFSKCFCKISKVFFKWLSDCKDDILTAAEKVEAFLKSMKIIDPDWHFDFKFKKQPTCYTKELS